MRIFKRFPWLFFALAIVLIANNYFAFDPNQVLSKPLNIIVPAVFILMGAGFYFWKWYDKNENKD